MINSKEDNPFDDMVGKISDIIIFDGHAVLECQIGNWKWKMVSLVRS